MIWDYLITILVLLIIGLAVWASASRMTVPDLIRELWSYITEKKEELTEGTDPFMYN